MTLQPPLQDRLIKGDLAPIFYVGLTKLIIHLVINFQGGYGLFRDEFYYLACADNLAFGYVDHPPLSVFFLKLNILLFGDSIFSVRLIPALAGALTIWLTGLMTIRMGGGKLATWIACIFSLSLGNFVMMSFYSMNSLEILSWTAAAYILLRIIQNGNTKLWLLLGIVLGLGLMNKIGVLFLGAGIFFGLLLTPERKWLRTPWPYVSGIIAALLFLPYVLWNIQHDYPHLEFIHNASTTKYSALSIIDFLVGQLLINNPVALLIWLPGLFALLFNAHLKTYRMLAYLYIVPLLIFVFNNTSKDVYLLPAYGVLWASGGVWFELMVQRFRYMKFVVAGLVISWLITTVIFLPMVLPVLPVEKYISYSDWLGFKPSSSENKELSELPQFYADMFGWKEKTETVALAYNSLTDDEKSRCAIYSNNYGRCASIDYFGKRYGLPKTIGNHNNYWIWGPREFTGDILIAVGGKREDYTDDFELVEQSGVSECEYCMPYESNVPVFICRKFKGNLKDIWAGIKNYN